MIPSHEILVGDIIGLMDRVSFPTECMDENLMQNAMYCSCDCNMMVNNVLMYGLDGNVFFCVINFPESLSDSTMIAHFMPFIKE